MNLRHYRKLKNIKVPALAATFGISRTAIYYWESATTRPSFNTLERGIKAGGEAQDYAMQALREFYPDLLEGIQDASA